MSQQTLLHLLYFLPALVVYGLWTYYVIKNKDYKIFDKDYEDLADFIVNTSWNVITSTIIIFLILVVIIEGIKYFTN